VAVRFSFNSGRVNRRIRKTYDLSQSSSYAQIIISTFKHYCFQIIRDPFLFHVERNKIVTFTLWRSISAFCESFKNDWV